jgi:hypothetical protein
MEQLTPTEKFDRLVAQRKQATNKYYSKNRDTIISYYKSYYSENKETLAIKRKKKREQQKLAQQAN